MNKPLTLTATLGLILTTGWALAGEDHPGSKGPRMMGNMMQQMDVDKNGSITRKEFDDFGKKRRQEHFTHLDSNKDGSVTMEEFSKAHSDRANKHFSRMDRDGNGVIDKTEMTPPNLGQQDHSGHNPNANGSPEKH